MAKKRKQKSHPQPQRQRQTPKKTRGLIEGDAIDNLDPPNHLVSPTPTGRDPFPQTRLRITGEKSQQLEYAFMHPRYGSYFRAYWENTPPAWMDPVLFTDMAKRDPHVRKLLQACLKRNKKEAPPALLEALDRVFQEKYLVFLRNRFSQTRKLLAEWLVINAADRTLREKEKGQEAVAWRRRRKRKAGQKSAKKVE